ncbi:GT2D2 protein, partial [Amia calva]|nr:GT2D2 protein [Amia calva]
LKTSKKRKIDKEGRVFQERWEWEYLFVEQSLKPVCLFCKESLSMMKEFNIRAKAAQSGRIKKKSLELQQAMFKRAKTESDAVVKASYIVSQENVKMSRCFSDGVLCAEKTGLLARMQKKLREENGQCPRTIYHCILHQEALCGKVLNIDNVMHTVKKTLHLISARGLNQCQFQASLEELHTEVFWLSRGVVPKTFFELWGEIRLFLQNKGRQLSELLDESCLCDFAFLCNVTEHLNTLNMKLTGSKQVITEMYDSAKAFQLKLSLQSPSFSSLAPKWWNDLPTEVKTAESLTSFRRLLKTHLF